MERPERLAIAVDLAVPPGSHDEEVVAGLADLLELFPGMDAAVHVLMIPQSLLPQGRNIGGVDGQQLVERLALPEGVI